MLGEGNYFCVCITCLCLYEHTCVNRIISLAKCSSILTVPWGVESVFTFVAFKGHTAMHPLNDFISRVCVHTKSGAFSQQKV